jgi:hypothetical protein
VESGRLAATNQAEVERASGVWDISSGPGRLLLAFGFFAFVGFVVVVLILGLTAQNHYRRGLSNINPLGWTAAGFLLLLLIALVRSCI